MSITSSFFAIGWSHPLVLGRIYEVSGLHVKTEEKENKKKMTKRKVDKKTKKKGEEEKTKMAAKG
jgi:hypothetical protein